MFEEKLSQQEKLFVGHSYLIKKYTFACEVYPKNVVFKLSNLIPIFIFFHYCFKHMLFFHWVLDNFTKWNHIKGILVLQVIFDLHLPGMACLTGKRSSQNLLLRVLKVVIQLREAAKKSLVRGPSQQRTGLSRGGLAIPYTNDYILVTLYNYCFSTRTPWWYLSYLPPSPPYFLIGSSTCDNVFIIL